MEFTRHMFVNYDEVDAVLEVEARENIGVFAMRFEGDEIEEQVATWEVPAGEESVRFEVVIPAGEIRGFGAYSAPRYTGSERLAVRTASGKDPWPPPPPPSPLSARDDFAKRYTDFLGTVGGEGEELAQMLLALMGNGKNPWPPPPPPPGLARGDFEERYASFLSGLSGDGEEPAQAAG